MKVVKSIEVKVDFESVEQAEEHFGIPEKEICEDIAYSFCNAINNREDNHKPLTIYEYKQSVKVDFIHAHFEKDFHASSDLPEVYRIDDEGSGQIMVTITESWQCVD